MLLTSNGAAPNEGSDRLPPHIDADTLRKYFTLNDADLEQVLTCRGGANRLGFAVQLCTLRWRGHFLRDTRGLPPAVLEILATQLGLLPVPIDDYPQNEKTRFEHLERIRQHLGFVRFGAAERERLAAHLHSVAAERLRSTTLWEAAWEWLRIHQVVRPGRTTLRDLLGSAREGTFERTYAAVTQDLTLEQREQLDALLLAEPSAEASHRGDSAGRSRLERFRLLPRRESPEALRALLQRRHDLVDLGFTPWPPLAGLSPAMRRLLASWGWRYDAWGLRRFPASKRHAILLCFLDAALAETTDWIVEMQDKLITAVHRKARRRRGRLLEATEEARRRAVEVLETLGTLVLDVSIPDSDLRSRILAKLPGEDIALLVEGCRELREGDDGSHLGLLAASYPYTRQYAPSLLEGLPLQLAADSALGRAVAYLQRINREGRRKLTAEAPLDFLSRRWLKYVMREGASGQEVLSRPHYEMALLTTLNERLKSGDVTVEHSRRWGDFEDYLISRETWALERAQHYAALGLPSESDTYLALLDEELQATLARVERHCPRNPLLSIDVENRTYHLAALKGVEPPETVKALRDEIEARLPRIELVDLLIDLDNRTDFLRHFLRQGSESRLSPVVRRRNVLAALIAVGCNLGPQRMAAASGLSVREISQVVDWYLTEDTLKAASVELVNYAAGLPLSQIFGRGDTCSADGMRFYVPVNLLAADYSHVLGDRGVTLYAHTADNCLRLHQQPIPCRLREATFALDGLLEHDTELDPRLCYTDTHGFTEVVMAAAALLGYQLAPRIKDMTDQTLYRIDRGARYPHLDPILTGTIKADRVRQAWDETVRIIASIHTRRASASLVLHRLGSYARQHSVHQALAEIGRVYKTIHILRVIDDEAYRRRMGRELNKGEASHDLSRFLCFGKEGALRGREFGDQLHTFSALSVLHNAVVAWNTLHIEPVVETLRAEGKEVDAETLRLITPLLRKHINPFGTYHFDLSRMRQTL